MFEYPKRYDVIVVGGGHAGVEAALAAARTGAGVLLLTMNLDTIGQMSCNPAIGGLAKGHLVREIDALGGEMGKATDLAGIQFRMLNSSKGPAVQAPRAQCDKKAYQLGLKWVCEKQERLDIKQATTSSIVTKDRVAVGVETTSSVRYIGTTIVITTGTFLRGLMHVGDNREVGGRSGEPSSNALSESLKKIGLTLGRLKTGTPPRLSRRTVDFSRTQTQFGDETIPFFSFWKEEMFHVEHPNKEQASNKRGKYPVGSVLAKLGNQVPCYITYTTRDTADLIRSKLHLSPLYCGGITGVGPRYCPSIEDKIVRFSEKERHQIFLEPEGANTEEIYVNGFSTSLPFEVQVDLVRTITGCERAEIVRPAYAVEYDFVFPTQLNHSLETKAVQNLFLAGQINGTSGYEEAAAQGLIAGINASLRVRGLEPLVLTRNLAYIGVLVDDLVTKGTNEPYRMFTSRSEYRLLLRQDNADLRLAHIGHSVGLINEEKRQKVNRKREFITSELLRLQSVRNNNETLAQLLRRPGVGYRDLPTANTTLDHEVVQQIEIEIKYAGYIDRQSRELEKLKALEGSVLPASFDYSAISNLRSEARQKLNKIRPATLGQASRISGVSPADVSVLMVWLKRHATEERISGKRTTASFD